MTPEQAINILYTAVRSINTTAENHDALSQAVGVIRKAIAPTEPVVDKSVTDESWPAREVTVERCVTDDVDRVEE